MSSVDRQFSIVVMAKLPVAGRVKTRLTSVISADAAADVHRAMLACVLERLVSVLGPLGARLFLAVDVPEDDMAAAWQSTTGTDWPRDWTAVRQGQGDLGQRMQTVARACLDGLAGGDPACSRESGIAFLGIDSPDVPAKALAAIPSALHAGCVVVGPVSDGGYWTLGASPWNPALVAGIDWGTSKVYDQTVDAIQRADADLTVLPAWFDVDLPDDLSALRDRLEDANEPALQRLACQLKHICEDVAL